MNTSNPVRYRRNAQGAVAVEMALVISFFTMLLTLLLFWAQVFWYYTMAHKAAHDAARFLSRASPAEMQTLGAGGAEAPVAGVARWIVDSEIGALRPVMQPFWIYIECGTRSATGGTAFGNCGSRIPEFVRVRMELGFNESLLPDMLFGYFGQNDFTLQPDVAMRYVGN
ncbi:TadE/TadG family type IV pilus assembly protein [Massilia sp.]|uniref:TadE/TadG family type IV pilus assembly protein n=1 Tax=Massilia sp. TaxID=1882437 RepID=UPI00289C4C70|nr:TadE/TadG family type IV pilus assembly protein [Massilia sp.]